jgi:tripeptide aminopeptidase
MGFNFDGGEANEIVHDIVGTERLVIDVTGVGVHTARPETGISCAEILADALGVLVNGGWHGVVERDGGWATANLGVLKGGTNSNVTMPALHALAECRSFDIDFRTKVLQAWRDAFEQAVERANQGAKERGVEGRATVTFAKGPEYPPCTMPESSPVAQAASAAIRRLGREPNLLRDAGGQDTCNIVAKGVPTVGVGCGMQHCHEYIEYLDVPEFLDGCRLAIDLASADLIS